MPTIIRRTTWSPFLKTSRWRDRSIVRLLGVLVSRTARARTHPDRPLGSFVEMTRSHRPRFRTTPSVCGEPNSVAALNRATAGPPRYAYRATGRVTCAISKATVGSAACALPQAAIRRDEPVGLLQPTRLAGDPVVRALARRSDCPLRSPPVEDDHRVHSLSLRPGADSLDELVLGNVGPARTQDVPRIHEDNRHRSAARRRPSATSTAPVTPSSARRMRGLRRKSPARATTAA